MTEQLPSRRKLLERGGVLPAGLAGGIGAGLGISELARNGHDGQTHIPEESVRPNRVAPPASTTWSCSWGRTARSTTCSATSTPPMHRDPGEEYPHITRSSSAPRTSTIEGVRSARCERRSMRPTRPSKRPWVPLFSTTRRTSRGAPGAGRRRRARPDHGLVRSRNAASRFYPCPRVRCLRSLVLCGPESNLLQSQLLSRLNLARLRGEPARCRLFEVA